MADLVTVAADVAPGTLRPPRKKYGTAGATIVAGQVVYRDPADGLLKLCDSDSSILTARAKGIAANGATAGQSLAYYIDGDVVLGVATTVAEIYLTSDTPGGIRPVADVDSGDWVSVLGVGIGNQTIRLGILNSDYQKA